MFRIADKMGKLKGELGGCLELLKLWYGDCIKAHTLSDDHFFVWTEQRQNTDGAKQRWNLSELSAKVGFIETAQRQIKANCTKNFVCEVLFWNLLK